MNMRILSQTVNFWNVETALQLYKFIFKYKGSLMQKKISFYSVEFACITPW